MGTNFQDRYALGEPIGRGAQGTTLTAIDRHSGAVVAVKRLRVTEMPDWKAQELFEREVATLRHLNHGAIPRYIDACFDDRDTDPSLYLVMEFIEGPSLAALLADGYVFSNDELQRLLKETLDVLDYLHQHSPPVIHRDLKPSNIIRRNDGSFAVVDFGAVQSSASGHVGGSTIVGTSGYLPLEQLRGQAVPASDLYALGATLVHLATGCDPNELETARGRIQYHERANLDRRLTSAIDAMIEPLVEDRAQSVADIRARLRGSHALQKLTVPSEGPDPVPDIVVEGAMARLNCGVLVPVDEGVRALTRPLRNPIRLIAVSAVRFAVVPGRTPLDLPPKFLQSIQRMGLEHLGYVEESFMSLVKFPNAVFTNKERTLVLHARRPIDENDRKGGNSVPGMKYHIITVTADGTSRISWGHRDVHTQSTNTVTSAPTRGSVEQDVAAHLEWIRDQAQHGNPPLIVREVQDCATISRFLHRSLMSVRSAAIVAALALLPVTLVVLFLMALLV